MPGKALILTDPLWRLGSARLNTKRTSWPLFCMPSSPGWALQQRLYGMKRARALCILNATCPSARLLTDPPRTPFSPSRPRPPAHALFVRPRASEPSRATRRNQGAVVTGEVHDACLDDQCSKFDQMPCALAALDLPLAHVMPRLCRLAAIRHQPVG